MVHRTRGILSEYRENWCFCCSKYGAIKIPWFKAINAEFEPTFFVPICVLDIKKHTINISFNFNLCAQTWLPCKERRSQIHEYSTKIWTKHNDSNICFVWYVFGKFMLNLNIDNMFICSSSYNFLFFLISETVHLSLILLNVCLIFYFLIWRKCFLG